MNPEKGIENLRVTISSNGTFGDFQAKDLALYIEESTKSATPIGIKGLGILSINFYGSHSPPLFLYYSSLSFFSSSTSFWLCFVYQLFIIINVSSKVLQFN